MPILINPVTGEIGISDDPTGALQQGWRIATDEEADAAARELDFGTVAQQAQAQGERVVRGATFGAVEGFGSAEDNRARAEVSEELSPVTSAVASIAPDVGVALLTGGLGGLATGAGRAAGRAALAEGAGIVRAGLAAGRAGGAAALAAESVGTGLVGAGQEAYAEGRTFADDPGRFAEDALIWGGLNFGLGAALGQLGRAAPDAPAQVAADELDDIARAAEVRAGDALPEESIPGVPGQVFDVEGAAPTAADAFVPLEQQLDDGLAAAEPSEGYQRARAIMDRMRAREAQAGSVDLGQPARSRDEVLDGLERVWTPEEKQVAHGYTHARFYEANEALRGLAPMTPDVQADVSKLEALFGKAVENGATYEGKTIRGIGLTPEEAAQLDSAGVLTAQGFMSSSTDPKVAKQFTNFGSTSERDVPVLFELEGRSGVPIGRGQAEVVHRPGTQFSVLGKRMEGEVPIYELREMGYQPGAPSDAIMGSVSTGDGAGFSLSGLATSPMGNVIAGGAGAAVGGAIGGEEGAALGAGLGFGASFGAGALRSRALAGAVRQGKREAVDLGVERALRRASKADADEIVQRAIGKAPEREADSLGRQRRLHINRDAIFQASERELSKDVGSLMKDVQQVTRTDKVAAISQHVSDNTRPQRSVANGISQDAAKFAGELRAEAKAYAKASGKNGIQYPISGAKDLNLALLDHASAVAKASTPRQMFEALDTFKRTLQEMKLTLEQGAANADNAIHHQRLIPRIDTFEKRIRSALEDSGTWGKAGEMQRAYNAVISDRLMPSMRIFEEAVLQRTHRGYDGVWNLEGWETKARALLKNTDPGNRRHVAAVLDGMDELASVRRKFGDAKTAERIEAQTAKVRRTIGLADEVHDASERMRALGELAGAVPLVGGTARSAAVGDLTAAWQRLSGASEAAAQRGVDDWIRSSRARGARGGRSPWRPELSPEARQLRDAAVKRGLSQTMALFQGDDDSPGAAFERWRDALLNQEKFFTELGEDYGALQQEAPEVFMALAARADLARRFLLERMPPNVAVSLANPDGYPPNRDAIEDWAQYVNAVRFPTRVVENLSGISVQEVETIRTVAPRLYELTQLRLIEGIARAQQAGEPLDDAFLQRIAILFPELDGAGSPVFSREFGDAVRAHQAMMRQARAASAPPGGGRRQARPSPLQATIENGATFGTMG